MTAAELQAQEAPERISEVALPRGRAGYPSPGDWRDEVLYFLLPDRFSDGREDERPLLNRGDRAAARPAPAGVPGWRWDLWAQSGGDRWQGGTLRGIASKLDYIAGLGATAIWVGPVFKQRGHLNTFHGYGIQDFLDVDPRFGTRDDLLALVKAAHAKGLRIILDIIFNHSGSNWDYRIDGARVRQPGYLPWPSFYPDFAWRSRDDDFVDTINSREDGVWPKELQNHDCYTRAGAGDLGAGDLAD